MVIHREEIRHTPQDGRQRHRQAEPPPRQRAEHRGIDRKGQNIVGEVDFPVGKCAEKAEEIAEHRKPRVLGGGPGRAEHGGGIQAVVGFGQLDGRGPETEFVKRVCHRLADEKVDRKRQRQPPEQRRPRRGERAQAGPAAAHRRKRPNAQPGAGQIEQDRAGQQHIGHAGEREPGRDTAQRRERRERRRHAGAQREKRAQKKQRRQRGGHAEKFHRK